MSRSQEGDAPVSDGLDPAFFDRYGDVLDAADAAELARKLDKIARLAPPRVLGRKGRYEERFCIDVYLRYLARHSLLSYPIQVRKTESPDFTILNACKSIGLEVTNASPELFEYAAIEAFRHRSRDSLESDILELDDLLERYPVEKILNASSSNPKWRDAKSRKPNERESMPGPAAESTEKTWVGLVLVAVIKKLARLNHEPTYAPSDVYELLIYDNTHLGAGLDVDKALPLLKQAIAKEKRRLKSQDRCFDKISVTHGSGLLYDVEAC